MQDQTYQTFSYQMVLWSTSNFHMKQVLTLPGTLTHIYIQSIWLTICVLVHVGCRVKTINTNHANSKT